MGINHLGFRKQNAVPHDAYDNNLHLKIPFLAVLLPFEEDLSKFHWIAVLVLSLRCPRRCYRSHKVIGWSDDDLRYIEWRESKSQYTSPVQFSYCPMISLRLPGYNCTVTMAFAQYSTLPLICAHTYAPCTAQQGRSCLLPLSTLLSMSDSDLSNGQDNRRRMKLIHSYTFDRSSRPNLNPCTRQNRPFLRAHYYYCRLLLDL